MKGLRKNERCPIHGGFDCCGRPARDRRFAQKRKCKPFPRRHLGKWHQVSAGVYRIEDSSAPKGYRERRSPAAMRRVLFDKIREQRGLCGICGKELANISDVVPDHKEPRGMGGARRDDSPDNIQAAHSLCNLEKGSKRA